MPEDESQTLLQELWDHTTKPDFTYRHEWRVGDVVMWDNTLTQHLAICDYALPQRRLLHRTTVYRRTSLLEFSEICQCTKASE